MRTREHTYENRMAHYRRLRKKLDQAYERVSYLRIAAITLSILAYFLGLQFEPRIFFYGVMFFFILVFFAGVVLHRRQSKLINKVNALVAINQEGRWRLEDRWEGFPMTGEEFLDSHLPYLEDLNLLGKNSLYQMIQLCSTTRGACTLANWLSQCSDFSVIPQRQEAVKELSTRLSMRQHLLMEARLLGKVLDPDRFLEWMKTPSYLTRRKRWVVLQRTLVPITFGLLGLHLLASIPPFWIGGLLIQLTVFVMTAGQCRRHYLPALNRDSVFLSYAAMFQHLEKQKFKADDLKCLRGKLFVEEKAVSSQMRKLERLNGSLGFYSSLLHPIINIFFLWDIHFLYQLEKWKETMAGSIDDCFKALGEMEALSSLAGFGYDNPDYIYPNIDPTNVLPLAAESIGHPLIPAKERIYNDFRIPVEGFLALITGSNMSGKSTFVRTIGINMALAFAGAPVAARGLSAKPCKILTCIQVMDSLRHHVSHFYAEVKRMKSILDAVFPGDTSQTSLPVLYLIDEIFTGTNTKERLMASKAIMLKLAESASYGVVTTHDLELVILEKDSTRIKNFHFKDEIDEKGRMVFRYRLHDGPVSSTNALEILKREGIYL